MSSESHNDATTLQLVRAAVGDRTPGEVERQVCSVSARSTCDDVCAMTDAADWLLARAKSIHQLSRQIAIEWIEANGEFDIGVQHYSVGCDVTVRCSNTKRCGHELLDSLHGSFDDLLKILVAQPYKPGAARHVLPAQTYSSLFIAEPISRLVTGAPARFLKRTDMRFVR